MKIELLYFDGCPNYERSLTELRELLTRNGISEEIGLRRVDTEEVADRERFLGSPTVRIDGADVEPGAGKREDFGVKCRLYRTSDGYSSRPPGEWIEAALQRLRSSES